MASAASAASAPGLTSASAASARPLLFRRGFSSAMVTMARILFYAGCLPRPDCLAMPKWRASLASYASPLVTTTATAFLARTNRSPPPPPPRHHHRRHHRRAFYVNGWQSELHRLLVGPRALPPFRVPSLLNDGFHRGGRAPEALTGTSRERHDDLRKEKRQRQQRQRQQQQRAGDQGSATDAARAAKANGGGGGQSWGWWRRTTTSIDDDDDDDDDYDDDDGSVARIFVSATGTRGRCPDHCR